MSQYDFGTIDPYTDDGVTLADMLNNWRDAIHSWHRGAARPSYAVPGMAWINDVGGPANWLVMVYLGPTVGDVVLFTYDTTTGIVSNGGGMLLAQAAVNPSVRWSATGNAANLKAWRATEPVDGTLRFGAYNDAGVEVAGITFTRDGKLIADLSGASGFPAAGVYVGTAPPASPTPNQQWWKSDTGISYIYYDDGSSQQWVPASPQAGAALSPQVAQAALIDPFTLGAAAWTDITGLSVAITPRSAASRFKLEVSLGKIGLANSTGVAFRLQRNGAPLGVGNPLGSRAQVSFATVNASSADHGMSASFSWLDNPGTASLLTYNLQGFPQSAGVIINASNNDANDALIYHGRAASTLIVTEVL